MARKGAPALYELLGRARDGKNSPAAPIKVPNNVPPRTTASGVLGRTNAAAAASKSPAQGPVSVSASASPSAQPRGERRPIPLPSWGVIGAAFAIVAIVLVYQLGVSRGSQQGDAAVGSTAPADTDLQSTSAGRRDPTPEVNSDSIRGSTSNAAPAGGKAGAAGTATGAGAQAPATAARASENQAGSGSVGDSADGAPLGPMPKGIDPRQAGLNYFVLASVLEANAEKMVQFCRDRGLDAWVVPDHNGRLREITVLPGIPKSELDGARAKALKARIVKVGLQWKAAARGNADFNACYPKLFNG